MCKKKNKNQKKTKQTALLLFHTYARSQERNTQYISILVCTQCSNLYRRVYYSFLFIKDDWICIIKRTLANYNETRRRCITSNNSLHKSAEIMQREYWIPLFQLIKSCSTEFKRLNVEASLLFLRLSDLFTCAITHPYL